MLDESHINSVLKDTDIKDKTKDLRASFKEDVAPMLDISTHDFLSLVYITPSLAIAKSYHDVNIFEELSINTKARKLSKGKYFLQSDPVAHAIKYLLDSFDKWEDKFYNHLKYIIDKNVNESKVDSKSTDVIESFNNSPHDLALVIETFFLNEGESIADEREISKKELGKVKYILEKTGLSYLHPVKLFLNTYKLKE
ncbi:hypothetical protein OO013_09435 [Mangrovivirga sp. M17]|uniref:Uncharacterized protein n=1 Tax=Mangrovivirga halotolerans TaxID=2993936 RepID=A0ABT3RR84_9BACT|nr:hypothetical protein [Mangrovivirga halotolerans]MCX2744087.1 hypothetical protein [Mangrovivirga halotolerans]